MKVGDLVQIKPDAPYRTGDDLLKTGLIIAMLTGGIGRKEPSCLIMWSGDNEQTWSVESRLELVE